MKPSVKRLTATQGLTLIEILIVIGIIAVLAAIVLVAINPARQFAQARDTERRSNTTALIDAVGQFIADHQGTLPDGITNSQAEIGRALCAELVPTYLAALPTDPQSAYIGNVEEDDCNSLNTGDVGYEIYKNDNGRVTIKAPLTEINDPDDDGTIDVIFITR